MMKIIRKHKLKLIGFFVGAGAGYLYFHFGACSNGTCAITSNPLNITIYGALMGAIFFNMFQKKSK
ncbi:MAG: hypothetical protein HYR91_05140 [Flavobacteriia bacterium]|nr:hypothetical protein [Flavobacteriia bacterium]